MGYLREFCMVILYHSGKWAINQDLAALLLQLKSAIRFISSKMSRDCSA